MCERVSSNFSSVSQLKQIEITMVISFYQTNVLGCVFNVNVLKHQSTVGYLSPFWAHYTDSQKSTSFSSNFSIVCAQRRSSNCRDKTCELHSGDEHADHHTTEVVTNQIRTNTLSYSGLQIFVGKCSFIPCHFADGLIPTN